jgi:hypothetical protein
MHVIRCVAAEWLIIRARLLRTRLGMWLVLLAAAFAWAAPPNTLAPLAARTGMLAGLLAVAFAVGARVDRLALRTTLSHPTSPLAVAVGRWLGATVAASLAVTGVSVAVALRDDAAPGVLLGGWLEGIVAAGAAAGASLPAVLAGGNVCAAALIAGAALLDTSVLSAPSFIYLAGAGASVGVAGAARVLARAS